MTLRSRVDELVEVIQRMNGITQELSRRAKLYEQLLDRAIMGLEELAKLGNAPEYGNSTGNVIAQQTLADIRKQLNGDTNG